jgi:nucleotide-binding universal stress UspA family protein
MAEAQAAVQALGVSHCKPRCAAARLLPEILAAATAFEADLLVIASRSDSHIGRAMIGGVAQKIIGLSEKPVLVLNLN